MGFWTASHNKKCRESADEPRGFGQQILGGRIDPMCVFDHHYHRPFPAHRLEAEVDGAPGLVTDWTRITVARFLVCSVCPEQIAENIDHFRIVNALPLE